MKALLISDIHSNIDALNAVWDNESGIDAVYCAGDVVDYGFFPAETIAWCREHKVTAVSGNHDRGMLALAKKERHPRPPFDTFARHNLSLLSNDDLAYLAALPAQVTFELDGITYYMAHYYREEDPHGVLHAMENHDGLGYFQQIWTEKTGEVHMPPTHSRRIILGHTHRCWLYAPTEHTMILNPGSISYRLGGDSRAKGADYMVIEDGQVYARHVDYPAAHLLQMVENSAFTEQEKHAGRSFYTPQADF